MLAAEYRINLPDEEFLAVELDRTRYEIELSTTTAPDIKAPPEIKLVALHDPLNNGG